MTKQAGVGRQARTRGAATATCIEVPDDVVDYGCDPITTYRQGHRSIVVFHDLAVDTAVDVIRHDDGIAAAGIVLTLRGHQRYRNTSSQGRG
jgi:hypothetical protein